jgi:tetratricopeptide (TPR) repeat protein
MRRTLSGLALLLVLALAAPLRAAKDDPQAQLAAAQAKLQQEDPQGALAILEPLLKKQPKLAEGYRLRANARLMLDTPGGKEDLDHALQLDPTLRQAWLDRAGVAVAEKRYDAALADFQKAHELQPADPDSTLNIGAVQLLMGKLDAASQSFESYLGQKPRDGQAQYMVARNYALAGYAGLAVQHLQQAIALDERMRAAARGDANFTELQSNGRFQQLLAVDGYQLPAGGHHATRTFPGASYQAGKGPLLPATMDALQLLGEPLQPQVEVTPDWALLWGAMRIKLSDGRDASNVELTAPAEAMSAAEFQQRSNRLLETILVQVSKRRASHRTTPATPGKP